MTASSENCLRRNTSTLLGCVLILAFAVYANSLFNGFVFDDHAQIEQNAYLHSPHSLSKILTSTGWSFQGSEGGSNFYRPVLTLGFLLCRKLFGSSPMGYHLVNVLLHVIVVWLVFAVALELFAELAVSLGAALLFAFHPIHTESVAWIAGVTDIEASLFFLLAFLIFLRLAKTPPSREIFLHVAMLLTFALALLSKETAITLPVLATIYEHNYRPDCGHTSWSTKFSRYAGLWVFVGLFLVLRLFILAGRLVPQRFHQDLTWPQTFLSGLSLTAAYLGKLFWPYPLSYYHPFQKSTALGDPRVLAGILILFTAVALFLILRRRARPYSFALLWIFATLALVLNARWMPGVVFAERYLYLPSVGFCWLLAGGFFWSWRKPATSVMVRNVALAATAATCMVLAGSQTFSRNRDWKDDRSLILKTLVTQPHASYFQMNLGAIYWSEGNRPEAERLWGLALTEDPANPVALWDMGLAMLEQKKYQEALHYLDNALALRPQYALPHVYRGRAYAALGRTAEAEADLRLAVEIDPQQTAARNTLGQFYVDAGRVAEAEEQFCASVTSTSNTDGWTGLAGIYMARKAYPQAEEAWKQVLALEPFSPRAHFSLGAIYLDSGRTAEAEKELQAGLLLDPHNPVAQSLLRKIHPSANAAIHP